MVLVDAAAIPVDEAFGDGVDGDNAEEVVEDEDEKGDGFGLVQVEEGLGQGGREGGRERERPGKRRSA